MRSVSAKNPIKVLRKICGITQEGMAQIIGCARLTVHNLEVEKLILSQRMAEKIAVHTGINDEWLLDPKRQLPPTCERDPRRPYSKDVFDMRRAEVLAARSKPLDVRAIQNLLAVGVRGLAHTRAQKHENRWGSV